MPHTYTSRVQPDLRSARVLVVEDEPFIAYDLVLAVEDAHGLAIGPAATIQEALDLIGSGNVEAAIVDVHLPDGHAGPVLEALDDRGVPVVVHTATALPTQVAARFPEIAVYTKPMPVALLTRHLASRLKR